MGSFLKPQSIDLIVSGPPYFNHVVYGKEKNQLSALSNKESFMESLRAIWHACSIVQKPGGILALWVHDTVQIRNETQWEYQALHSDIIRSVPVPYHLKSIGIWDRYLNRNRGALHTHPEPLGSRFQYILLFQNGEQGAPHIETSLRAWYWSPVWCKKTNPKLLGFKTLYRIAFKIIAPFLPIHKQPVREMSLRSTVNDEHSFTEYTTQCPPEIAERLINDFSNPGDVILDPFAGSGTTLDVAQKLYRKAIGIDIGTMAVKVARKRLSKVTFL